VASIVAPPMRKPLPITAAACALALLAGCGGSDAADAVDRDVLRQVVVDFAAADGPKACEMLSPDGVVDVYGGYTKPLAEARAECLKRSKRFESEQVHVQEIKVIDGENALISALGADRTVSYSVKLVKLGGEWLIEEINQAKVD
jgi:hypothetical protein